MPHCWWILILLPGVRGKTSHMQIQIKTNPFACGHGVRVTSLKTRDLWFWIQTLHICFPLLRSPLFCLTWFICLTSGWLSLAASSMILSEFTSLYMPLLSWLRRSSHRCWWKSERSIKCKAAALMPPLHHAPPPLCLCGPQLPTPAGRSEGSHENQWSDFGVCFSKVWEHFRNKIRGGKIHVCVCVCVWRVTNLMEQKDQRHLSFNVLDNVKRYETCWSA